MLLSSLNWFICKGLDQWCTQKVSEGAKVWLQSCDVTNQLYGECQRHDHSMVVRGHAPGKFCKIA